MTQPITLITGASAGLGVEFAKTYSKRGDRLVLVARREDRLKELAEELGNARVVAMDLSKEGAAAALFADLKAHDEQVDTLINNAGFGLVGRFESLDGPRQRQMIDLNCGVLTELAHGVLPAMHNAGKGAILNVASVASFQPGPGMAVYFATKAYVLSFTEALHEELKDSGIKVSALCPGPTSTEFGEVAGFGGNKAVETVAMTAEEVVRIGVEGLDRNKAVVVPGIANKISANSSRFLPRSTVRRIVNLIKK
ncbi:SDR family NAD(P)-dependent oxidoreductase [Sphingomicrobium sediminis]|uniref:SDR family oxidoreductase n=1 Tax=Sphingomicrobium sediminis TaxID=2950949 RepID=A0A9X2EH24_9SPHN|nr:SDR family oxidoreductase [Sphingomicrobium sediminis]MCM8557883.1 SDR family oxidoreductase [Sphingomicrobium sediminis]